MTYYKILSRPSFLTERKGGIESALERIVARCHLGFGCGRRARGGVPSRNGQTSTQAYRPREPQGLSETACGTSLRAWSVNMSENRDGTAEEMIEQDSLDIGGQSSSLQGARQPRLKCDICARTYRRHDHLARHVRSHKNERSYKCPDCGKGFNRADLLNRHHAGHSNDLTQTYRRRTGKACESCIRSKTKCDEERPCQRCKTRNTPCIPTESHLRYSQGFDRQGILGTSASINNDAARAAVTVSPISLGILEESSNLQDDYVDFPDFFGSIMMPTGDGEFAHETIAAPRNVSYFTQDIDLGPLDLDFSLLAAGLTRPPTAQGMRSGGTPNGDLSSTPRSDVQLRSETFQKSPWSWGHWTPERSNNTFSEQTEINIQQQRVQAGDQLTPGSEHGLHCNIGNEARDRMIRVVTQTADTRLAIPSFPSLELLRDLIEIFLMEEKDVIDSFIHTSSFSPYETRTELLLAMVAAGATYVALAPIWKMGLVIQEVVRIAIAQVFEKDNSTTRELEPLQAYLLWVDIGVWSGFRRKTEIASSFLQPAVTMLSWSNAFASFRYKDVAPTAEDDVDALNDKWAAWIEQESFKRLVVHTFIHDSQVAITYVKNPLVSPAQMRLPLPASKQLWLARDARSWCSLFLAEGCRTRSSLPPVMALSGNIRVLDDLESATDKALCLLIACHSKSYEVHQYRQQALLLANMENQVRSDRWLAHARLQKDLYEDLSAMLTYCELQTDPLNEALFTLEYLMVLLHVSIEEIQLFAGKSGEEEARRVYAQIRNWADDATSRITVWHAGQVLRIARSFEGTKLRDFYAVAVYHCTLTLWVYGMVTSHTARTSEAQTPVVGQQSHGITNTNIGTASSQPVFLDGEENKIVRAFRQLGHGKPCLKRSDAWIDTESRRGEHTSHICYLDHAKGIMLLGADILERNYPRSRNGLPPLVENLVNLMRELSKLSGRDP